MKDFFYNKMKNLFLVSLILLFAFSVSNRSDGVCEEYPPNDIDDLGECSDLKPQKGKYCCLLSYKLSGKSGTACISLTEDEFKDRNKVLSKIQVQYKDATGSVKCEDDEKGSSSFLKVAKSILSLLLILI